PQVRRPRLGQARRRAGGVRHRERAVHLSLGEHLAHASSQDDGRADAAAGHARTVLVLCAHAVPALPGAVDGADPARTPAAGARRAVSRRRGLTMIRRLVIAIWSAALAAALTAPALAAQPPTGQSEFLPMKDLPPTEQIPAAPLLVAGYAFIWVAVAVYVWTIWRGRSGGGAGSGRVARRRQRRCPRAISSSSRGCCWSAS